MFSSVIAAVCTHFIRSLHRRRHASGYSLYPNALLSYLRPPNSFSINRLFSCIQYGHGRVPTQIWVFGIVAIQYSLPRPILPIVNQHDACTLEPLVIHHYPPGTTIWSDGWAVYSNLQRLGYQHSVAKHCHNFVDPATGVSVVHYTT